MILEKMSKPELQQQYAKHFGAAPSGLSKAELIEAIEAKLAADVESLKASEEVFSDNLEAISETIPAGDAITATVTEPAPLPEGVIEIVKTDDLGNITDRQTTTKDAWNLLPGHKYGWKMAAPKEIQ